MYRWAAELHVRTAAIDQRRVVVRAHAAARAHVHRAHGRHAVAARDAVGAREGPEVAVERTVLLHDHDEVLDLVDPGRELRGASPARSRAGGTAARGAAAGGRLRVRVPPA